jgi:hypothetical protein
MAFCLVQKWAQPMGQSATQAVVVMTRNSSYDHQLTAFLRCHISWFNVKFIENSGFK